jgi:4-hydroxy-tetrahydrodipicolinate synthase
LVTPFTLNGEIDVSSLRRLVAYLQAGGINEFFVAGSTGESPLLADADRTLIVETVRRAAPDALIYAGISGTGHRHAIQNARSAADAGANAAVVMSPYFLLLDQDQLVAFCQAVADGSPVPLAVYHHLRMPSAFSVSTIARLAAHPNIIGVKDTNGGEHNRCAEILAATAGHRWLFFQGVEKLVLSTLRAGGHGCVVAQGCIAPRLFRGLFDAWQAGDQAAADELQRRIEKLWTLFSRPEVKQSFFHFIRTLKLPLQQRGVLATAACALPGVQFDPAYDRMITEFIGENPDLHPVAAAN